MHIFKAVVAAIAAGLIAVPLAAAADEASPPTISVTGQGTISRSPDLATVSVTIVTSDDSAQRALSENNRRFAALSAKLAAAGTAASDITSTSIESYFNPRPETGAVAHGQPYGFVVTRGVAINARSIDGSGAIVDAATAAGATQLNGVSYGFRDRRAVERDALAAAVADAYAQAQTLANAAHVQIVRVLHISNESGPARIMPLAMKAMSSAEAPVPTTINPSALDVTGTVSVTFAIR